MSVSLGSTNIKEMYLGNTKIKEAYLGSTKVFGGEEEQEEYLKISYNKLPTIYGDSYQSKTEYIDINNSNNIIDSSVINIMSSALGDPMPMPIVYVNLCNKDNGQYFALMSSYPEFSYDKINWTRFDGKEGVALQYGETVYIRSYKPLSSQSQANAITINTRNIDYSNIYNKTTSGGDTVQCYRCVSYGYKSESGNTFNYDYPLVSISGNLQAIVNYEYPDYVKLDSAMPYMFTYCKNYLYDISKLVLPWSDLNNKTSAFSSMFSSCKFITKTPELPATTLSSNCYQYMFAGCTSLTTARNLPAIELKNSCYECMFRYCTSLITSPELPALTLQSRCYYEMFYNCVSLTKASEIHAISHAYGSQYCCYSMFENCSLLNEVQDELHNPFLYGSNYIYSRMYYNCSSLIKAPDLPATSISSHCYDMMFTNCTSLVTAPDLPSISGSEPYCYYYMFSGCTSMTSARIYSIYPYNRYGQTPASDNSMTGMFNGINTNGILFYDYYGDTTPSSPLGWWPSGWVFKKNYLEIEALENNSSIRLETYSGFDRTKLYITDDLSSSWYSWDSDIPLNFSYKGKKMYIWNSGNTLSISDNEYCKFVSSDGSKFKISGGINSLINFDNTPKQYTFYNLFSDNSSIIKAPLLLNYGINSTNYSETAYYYSYANMFKNCINLENTPEIMFSSVAKWNYRYYGMFEGCIKIKRTSTMTSISDYYGIGEYVFSKMYEGCKNLKYIFMTTYSYSPGNIGEGFFYRTFYGCENLTNFSFMNNYYGGIKNLLSYKTLSVGCYNSMFEKCKKLTEVPNLPSTESKQSCYYAMFRDCENLISGPEIKSSNTSGYCFFEMFKNCKKLNYIKIHYTGTFGYGASTNAFYKWVEGVSENGDFYYNGSDTTRGENAIPEDWTVHTF